MPGELRFCRNCGFRLGEGVSEYTPTERFDSARAGMVAAGVVGLQAPKKKRRMSGMAGIFVALLVFVVGGAAFTAIITPIRENVRTAGIIQSKPKSFVGVNGFDTADSGVGVTFDSVSAPDTPFDKAGLVGGDIITTWDGQQVSDEDHITELLVSTPIGKTVDIEYLRDGEKKTAKLTTISAEEGRRLSAVFERRPEGRGQFGYDDDDVKRVEIPGTKLHGVQLDEILPNRPADLAGIKKGDIVIQWDDTPIRTGGELLMRVRRALPYSTIDVTVMRAGEEGKPLEKIVIPVKMGKG